MYSNPVGIMLCSAVHRVVIDGAGAVEAIAHEVVREVGFVREARRRASKAALRFL
jgi:hypothetical protein